MTAGSKVNANQVRRADATSPASASKVTVHELKIPTVPVFQVPLTLTPVVIHNAMFELPPPRVTPNQPIKPTVKMTAASAPADSADSSKQTAEAVDPSTRPAPKPPAPPKDLPTRQKLMAWLQPPAHFVMQGDDFWLPFKPFDYQFEGIQFLNSRWQAILADEMGLGKTMQTIVAMRLLIRAGQAKSALLVCPKPLVTNWQRELHLWADDIPVAIIRGDSWQRKSLWLYDRSPIKLVNYETLTRDYDMLQHHRLEFDLVVLDEAQRIKNADGKTGKICQALRRHRSWALTGTPVENHARDLTSILKFLFGQAAPPPDRLDLLRDEVTKVCLRRTKEMVMKDMPPRLIRDTYIDLGPAQRMRYDAAEKDGVFQLNEYGEQLTIEHVFDLIRRLKQICNYDPVTNESTKLEYLRSTMQEIADSGKKAILFSQWVSTMEWLAERLPEFNPLLYHGGVSTNKRDPILQEFKESKDRPLLLLSYGTGAVGLNLQFTNYVFLYDRWWNPAIEDQAINRAHRIGQKEPVFVFRFLSPETIEERIHDVLEKKRELFNYLIDGTSGESLGLSRDDLLNLFQLRYRKAA